MKITIENTDQTVTINGVPARIWQGHTDSGVPIHCFVTRIAVANQADASQFERELQETQPLRPELQGVYPARLVL